MLADKLTVIEQLLLNDSSIMGGSFASYSLTVCTIRKQTFITPIAVNPEDVEIGIVKKAPGYLVTLFKLGERPEFLFFEKAVTVS